MAIPNVVLSEMFDLSIRVVTRTDLLVRLGLEEYKRQRPRYNKFTEQQRENAVMALTIAAAECFEGRVKGEPLDDQAYCFFREQVARLINSSTPQIFLDYYFM